MIKLFIILFGFSISFLSISQDYLHAFGVRNTKDNYGFLFEVSYRNLILENQGFELDVSSRFKTNTHTSVISYRYDIHLDKGISVCVGGSFQATMIGLLDDSYFGVGGLFGIEFNLTEYKLPIALTIDIRPIKLFDTGEVLGVSPSLGIRYLIYTK